RPLPDRRLPANGSLPRTRLLRRRNPTSQRRIPIARRALMPPSIPSIAETAPFGHGSETRPDVLPSRDRRERSFQQPLPAVGQVPDLPSSESAAQWGRFPTCPRAPEEPHHA